MQGHLTFHANKSLYSKISLIWTMKTPRHRGTVCVHSISQPQDTNILILIPILSNILILILTLTPLSCGPYTFHGTSCSVAVAVQVQGTRIFNILKVLCTCLGRNNIYSSSKKVEYYLFYFEKIKIYI